MKFVYATAIPSWKHYSSRTNTKVKQFGPQVAFGWVTIQGGCCSYTSALKSQKRRNGPSIMYMYILLGQKTSTKKQFVEPSPSGFITIDIL